MVTRTQIREGCRKHAMSEAEVQRWWAEAERRGAADPAFWVGMCACCLGPCPVAATGSLCKRCTEVGDV